MSETDALLTETEAALLRRSDLQDLIQQSFEDRESVVRHGQRPQRQPEA